MGKTKWWSRIPALATVALAGGLAACSGADSAGFVNRTADDYCTLSDRSTLLLIDRTTTFDAADQARLMESLGRVVDGLDTGDRIIIATISDHYSNTRRLANACKPGCPAAGVMDQIAGSCSTMKARQDQQQFAVNLAGSLREIMDTADDASGSDIIRTLAHWTEATGTAKPYTSIVIHSDMLENSEMIAWSRFAPLPEEDLFNIVAEHDAGIRARGAAVRIIGYGRLHDAARSPLPAALDLKLRSFWSRYFLEGGAEVTFASGMEG